MRCGVGSSTDAPEVPNGAWQHLPPFPQPCVSQRYSRPVRISEGLGATVAVGAPGEFCTLCAWIVLKPGQIATAQEIKAFRAGQIAHYKVPRYIANCVRIGMRLWITSSRISLR
ncbi:hypothetical protein AU467_02675 [Mesorhizobium loti]|uniref:Uncharacterized protein n=1 Tax=Rhizobium loti TaxID=381 RepID=A0A101KUS2_RHILI|nr:hypothetical protein AU467_02675 [Mesorhizobium loti]